MFKQNEGVIDRIVRVTLGTALLPVGLFLLSGLQGSAFGLVTAGFGGWVLITGIIGFCPLYIPIGINTREKEKELFERVKAVATRHMDRCMAMMAGYRQRPAGSGNPSAIHNHGSFPPSIERTPNQQG